MTTHRSILGCLAALSLLSLSAGLPGAQSQPPAAKEPAKQTISSVALMAGQWRGQTEDGIFEEHWSRPEGNSVMGMFRWLKPDGTPVMFEILTITEEPDGVFLRLMHFSAKLVGREEKGDAMTLKLAEAGPTKAVFKAVETEKRLAAVMYERPSPDVLRIKVEFPDPAREPLNFELKRATVSGK